MDLAAIRARIAQLNSKTKKQGKIWKPKDEHDVRGLPLKGTDDPFKELKFHYELGDQPPVLCPTNSGNPCEICAFAERLRAWKNPDGTDKMEVDRKKDFELFRKMQAKSRYFMAIVERGREAEGAMYWPITPKTYDRLLQICSLEPYNRARKDGGGSQILTSVDSGYDLHVSFKKPGEKGNKTTFFLTEVDDNRIATPLMERRADVERILESIPDIGEIYPEVSSADAERILKRFLGEGTTLPDPTVSVKLGTEYGGPYRGGQTQQAPTNSREKALTGGKTIDEAFEDLVEGQ